MESLNNLIFEYTDLLKKGRIQKAYKGIISFMSGLKAYLEKNYSDYFISGVYQGYMDMTFITFTPNVLKNRNLKIAIVYLHEEARFELWLTGRNRQIQADYIELFSGKDIESYTLSKAAPGVDAIISAIIEEDPDFDDEYLLINKIEIAALEFIDDLIKFLDS
jgi:hypothetical protein